MQKNHVQQNMKIITCDEGNIKIYNDMTTQIKLTTST